MSYRESGTQAHRQRWCRCQKKKGSMKEMKKVVWHKFQSDVKTQWKAGTQRHRQTDETKI